MFLATTDAANDLLAHDPLALLIGMLLDQQIPMEKAFTSPEVLRERMAGGAVDAHALDVRAIADYDADAFEQLFRRPPALHRFPAAMAKRTQALAGILVERFDADAATVWTGATTGADLVARIAELPGFGTQKAKIFAALLGKQFGVQPRGWRAATGDYGVAGSTRSIADVTDGDSLRAVRAHKQAMKAAARAAAE